MLTGEILFIMKNGRFVVKLSRLRRYLSLWIACINNGMLEVCLRASINKSNMHNLIRDVDQLHIIFKSPNCRDLSSVTQPQKIIIVNNHGEKLVGLLHDTGSKELVILCHGFSCSKEETIMVNISAVLEKERISAFRFDFAGNGESDGSFSFGNYMREVEDLHSVVNHFNGENRVVSAILGHSKGGDIVLLYASKYNDVHTVVNLSGRYDLKKGIGERLGEDFMERIKTDRCIDVKCKVTGKVMYRVTEEGLMDRWNTDVHEACLRIDKDCRVLTVHGSADEVIPVEEAHEFSKIIPNHKLHIIEGANHCYSEHQAELAPVVVDFIKACLQQDQETSP